MTLSITQQSIIPAPSSSQGELLKIIAILTMLADHANKILLSSEYPLMTDVGRLAFPLFALMIGWHLGMNHTTEKKYLSRILPVGLLILPLTMALFTAPLNIMFTLAAGIALWGVWSRYDRVSTLPGKCLMMGVGALILAVGNLCDYGIPGVLMVWAAIACFRQGHPWQMLVLLASIAICNKSPYYGAWALAAIPLWYIICQMPALPLPRLNKWVFYAFYPAHLVALVALSFHFVLAT